MLYCSVSETASDSNCVRNSADRIAYVGRKEIPEKYFSFNPVYRLVVVWIVPGLHFITFVRIVEK
jgi:hypothetical protein